MRSILPLIVLTSCSMALGAGNHNERPIIGVIRWDAFYGTGNVPQAVEKSLGPAKYHHRAPFFAKVTGKDKLSINGDTDEIMAQEIAYAAQAGVYWAFLTYPWKMGLSAPLRRFIKHPDREKINFTLILSDHSLINEWDKFFKQALLDSCVMPNFQTVLGGRQLIYFFFPKYEKGPDKEKLAEVRALVKQKTGKNPYFILLMHGIPQDKWPEMKKLGYDASTQYAQFARKKMTFAAFDKQIRGDWKSWAKKKYQHSPLLSAGWDNRPRYYNPVPWVKKSKHMLSRYCETPTPQELAAHFKAGMDFVYKNKGVCEAQNLLMYAWNEHDEGGWLCPTLDPKTGRPDDSRVKAVGEMMSKWTPPKP